MRSTYERLFGGELGGRYTNFNLNVPPQLVGFWQSGEGLFRLDRTGQWATVNGPFPYALSQDGNGLEWSERQLKRYENQGITAIGIWRGIDNNHPVEVCLNANGTYLWSWLDRSESYEGRYVIRENLLTVYETRALVTVEDNRITFEADYGDLLTGTFIALGKELQLTFDREAPISLYRCFPELLDG
jgi:hypothetical protein